MPRRLQQGLDRVTRRLSAKIPEMVWEKGLEAKKKMVAQTPFSSVPKIGQKAPLFILPDGQGHSYSLAETLAKGPAVLNFFRGGWCEYCNLELRAFQDALTEGAENLAALKTTLMAISPQNPEKTLWTAQKNRLKHPVLSDQGNQVARSYGLVYPLDRESRDFYVEVDIYLPDFNGDDSWELPHPGTFVIGRDGTILWSFVNADYSLRAEPQDVLDALAKLT